MHKATIFGGRKIHKTHPCLLTCFNLDGHFCNVIMKLPKYHWNERRKAKGSARIHTFGSVWLATLLILTVDFKLNDKLTLSLSLWYLIGIDANGHSFTTWLRGTFFPIVLAKRIKMTQTNGHIWIEMPCGPLPLLDSTFFNIFQFVVCTRARFWDTVVLCIESNSMTSFRAGFVVFGCPCDVFVECQDALF